MKQARRILCAALLALTGATGGHTSATPINFTDVVVFGDSLSDVGNTANNFWVSIFAPQAQPPNWQGRFSNGPVWAERLGNQLGHNTATRSSVGGDNYSAGGALAGDGTNFLGLIDNLGNQIDDYLGSNHPNGGDLFVLWGGGNDFIEIGGSLGEIFSGGGSPIGVAHDMADNVTRLANNGAERFLVLNMPRLGQIPRYLGTADQAQLNATATQYNNELDARMDALALSLNIDITIFDVETTFDRLLAEPAAFGFTNTTTPAYNESSGSIVANPNAHVFWDAIHPTTAAHAILADAAFVALHDPGDFTGDGIVDAADLTLVLSRFDQPTAPFNLAEGDWDGDGQVGMAEVDLVLANWTQPVPANVPEPGALACFGLALTVFTASRSSPGQTRRRCGR